MKILLTGAAGRLARLAAHALAAGGHEVVGIDVRYRPNPDIDARFEWVKRYDHRHVTEVFRRERPELLLHLGVRAGGSQAQAKSRYTQNVLGTRHLLKLCLQYGVGRVVALSTFHVYGAHPHNPTFMSEDHPLRAVQTFPELQDVVELDHAVTTFMWRHRSVPTILLRPVHITGSKLHNQVSTLLRNDYTPRLIGFNPMMQFIHQSDVVRAIQFAIERGNYGVYNIAGEGALPWRTAIETAGGRPLPLPTWVAYPGARAVSMVYPAFPEHLMDFFRYPVIVTDQAARTDLGWKAQTSVLDTLRSVRDVPPPIV